MSMSIARFLCRLLGHRPRVQRLVSTHVAEVRCERCGREYGIHADLGLMLPLDSDLRHAHAVIAGDE